MHPDVDHVTSSLLDNVLAAWRDVLKLESVNPDDNFFDLGGDSLTAARLVSRIKELGRVEIQLRDLFEAPTPRDLILRATPAHAIEPVIVTGRARRLPASISQEYNYRDPNREARRRLQITNAVYRFRGDVDVSALEYALQGLVDRHEALRVTLQEDSHDVWMVVHERVKITVEVVRPHGATLQEREDWARQWIDREVRRPVDRENAPLLRATLLSVAADDWLLVLVSDHFVTDGWSFMVMGRELSDLYAYATGALPDAPPPPGMQFPAWSMAQRESLTEARLAAVRDYWRGEFGPNPDALAIRFPGYASASSPSYDGVEINKQVDPVTVTGLRRQARQSSTTLFALMSAALLQVLRDATGQERIALMTTTAERTTAESQSMIGYCTNTIWVPIDVKSTEPVSALAQRFQARLLTTLEQSALVPTMLLLNLVWPDHYKGFPAVPQVYFLLADPWTASLQLPSIEATALEWGEGSAQPGMQFYATDRGDEIDLLATFIDGEMDSRVADDIIDGYLGALSAAASSD